MTCMEHPELPRLLRQLARLVQERDRAQRRVDDAVVMLLSPNLDGTVLATQAQVAEVLGVTRQAVSQRYVDHG